MFTNRSRYAKASTYTLERGDGSKIVAIRPPVQPHPRSGADLRGMHKRLENQRLDLIAAHYLGDATAFFRLCDASDTLSPDALAARSEIPIPKKDR